ncbi:MAG: hypothetical protein GY796_19985 [Chloroflexi bacterium]|nr:hypothetical protein [Chloroflexota bacterium]
MRIQKKKDEESAQRKGLTGRTIIMVIWFGISFAVAYFLTTYLFNNDIVTYNTFYTDLRLPTSIPEWGVQLIFMFVIVLIMQFILYLGFFFGSPEGRRRTGDPTMYSRNKDPFDDGRY